MKDFIRDSEEFQLIAFYGVKRLCRFMQNHLNRIRVHSIGQADFAIQRTKTLNHFLKAGLDFLNYFWNCDASSTLCIFITDPNAVSVTCCCQMRQRWVKEWNKLRAT